MRPNIHRRYVVSGKYGVYTCPTITAVDNRLRALAVLLRTASPGTATRIRHDTNLLLDWRSQLMEERGATS